MDALRKFASGDQIHASPVGSDGSDAMISLPCPFSAHSPIQSSTAARSCGAISRMATSVSTWVRLSL
jgi:hypothetical protein